MKIVSNGRGGWQGRFQLFAWFCYDRTISAIGSPLSIDCLYAIAITIMGTVWVSHKK